MMMVMKGIVTSWSYYHYRVLIIKKVLNRGPWFPGRTGSDLLPIALHMTTIQANKSVFLNSLY